MAETVVDMVLETRLRTAWPSLGADERQLILDLVWATVEPNSALADVFDDHDAISALRINPRPRGSKKLVARPGWRVRVGEYRVVYDVDDAAELVTIHQVDHRRQVYR